MQGLVTTCTAFHGRREVEFTAEFEHIAKVNALQYSTKTHNESADVYMHVYMSETRNVTSLIQQTVQRCP